MKISTLTRAMILKLSANADPELKENISKNIQIFSVFRAAPKTLISLFLILNQKAMKS